MMVADLRARVIQGVPGQFDELSRELSGYESDALFWALYPMAVDQGCGPRDGELACRASWRAGALLVDRDPACPVECDEALRLLAAGDWNLSFREVPFYLACQFGKWPLRDAVGRLLGQVLGNKERVALEGVEYCLRGPSAGLLTIYWQVRERCREAFAEQGVAAVTAAIG